MRADRLLSIVMLLQHRGRLTADDIAAELEVSRRTVLRDIEALSTSGVPVYTDRGRGGGISLIPGYRTDLTGLTLVEAKALLASSPGQVASPAFASAMRKVAAALPESHRAEATQAAQRILVRPDGFTWPSPPEPPSWKCSAPSSTDCERARRIAVAQPQPASEFSTRSDSSTQRTTGISWPCATGWSAPIGCRASKP